MNVRFLVIPYESVYNDILGRSFLVILDTVTSQILLKMKYHKCATMLVVISIDLRRAFLIHEVFIKNPLTITVTCERRRKKTCQTVSKVDLDVREDKTTIRRQTQLNDRGQRENLRTDFGRQFQDFPIQW